MKKFNEQLKAQIMQAFASRKEFMAGIKAEGSDRTFEVIASTEGQDRQGEVVMQDGIDIKNYLNNPVILFGHDYWSLPIGKATEVFRQDGKTIVRGVFASKEANPVAEQVYQLYKEGVLTAVSIGFIPKRYEGNRIVECELLELSFVPVPANPEALSVLNFAKEHGVVKEFAYALKTAVAAGVELEGEAKELAEKSEEEVEQVAAAEPEAPATEIETKTEPETTEDTVPTEEEVAKAAHQAELKAVVEEVLSNHIKTLADEVKELVTNLTKEVVELKGLVAARETDNGVSKSGEEDVDLKGLLKDSQLIASVSARINKTLKLGITE